MTKISSCFALVVAAGVLFASPAFAAPYGFGSGGNNGSSTALDCTLQVNIDNPLCAPPNDTNHRHRTDGRRKRRRQPGQPVNDNNGPNSNNGPTGNWDQNGNDGQNGDRNRSYDGGPSYGTFNFGQHDRRDFDQRFRGYNFGDFGFFAAPSFTITIGTPLPYSYHRHLRPVPWTVYHYYPWFRGYLYFVDRRGDFVIVSPRSYRIVAVL